MAIRKVRIGVYSIIGGRLKGSRLKVESPKAEA
jgi:hypothetical protein